MLDRETLETKSAMLRFLRVEPIALPKLRRGRNGWNGRLALKAADLEQE